MKMMFPWHTRSTLKVSESQNNQKQICSESFFLKIRPLSLLFTFTFSTSPHPHRAATLWFQRMRTFAKNVDFRRTRWIWMPLQVNSVILGILWLKTLKFETHQDSWPGRWVVWIVWRPPSLFSLPWLFSAKSPPELIPWTSEMIPWTSESIP